MRMETVRGRSLQEAKAKLYERLGEDAMILSVSENRSGRFIDWLLGRRYYEVLGISKEHAMMMSGRPTPVAGGTYGFQSRTGAPIRGEAQEAAPAAAPASAAVGEADGEGVEKVLRRQTTLFERLTERLQTMVEKQESRLAELTRKLEELESKVAPPSPPPNSASVQVEILEDREAVAVDSNDGKIGRVLDLLSRKSYSAAVVDRVKRYLLECRKDEEWSALDDEGIEGKVRDYLCGAVATCGGLGLSTREEGMKIVALVGPTGAGKTTTIAKLAAGLQLNFGLKVALVSIDTFRLAACEQLKVYADIIGIPVQVAFKEGELKDIVEYFADRDVILVDTVGRNSKNLEELDRMRAMLECVPGIEKHLVLPATSQSEVMARDGSNFSDRLGWDKLIFTKLDEAAAFGPMVSYAVEAGRPLSFLTTGQNVPDDIRIVDRAVLEKIVLAEDCEMTL